MLISNALIIVLLGNQIMMLTTKGRYAVMAIIHMALEEHKKPMKINDIAISQNITTTYLEQIYNKLKLANIVISFRGPGGGYILAKKPQDIKIQDIIDAVEEKIKIVRCTSDETGCMPDGIKCHTHYLWLGLEQVITDYFSRCSIEDVISNKIPNITNINCLNLEK